MLDILLFLSPKGTGIKRKSFLHCCEFLSKLQYLLQPFTIQQFCVSSLGEPSRSLCGYIYYHNRDNSKDHSPFRTWCRPSSFLREHFWYACSDCSWIRTPCRIQSIFREADLQVKNHFLGNRAHLWSPEQIQNQYQTFLHHLKNFQLPNSSWLHQSHFV